MDAPTMTSSPTSAVRGAHFAGLAVQSLNRECFCVSLDPATLDSALASQVGEAGIVNLMRERCPYAFSARPVFVSHAQQERMMDAIRAVESVVALPAYREQILAAAPAIARHDPGGAKGVFLGYDFHVTDEAIGLIEVNTNAGGAMLNAVLARAQRRCCAPLRDLGRDARTLEENIVAMFRNEWRLSGGADPLRCIAIVDESPEVQYLYSEFLLFQRLFERHGLKAVIADPRALTLRDGGLWHGDTRIDLIYNRLTDFMLEAPSSAVVREAYLQRAAVLTPHPQAHALYADKRNLAIWSDARQLEALDVLAQTQDILLANIPRTEIVDAAQADRLWRGRRGLFFKPMSGFGSRAAYRGDKLTQRVWRSIVNGDYVAQAFVPPGQRVTSASAEALKFDVRHYVYEGAVQWVAARLYQGQTTNFRTPGGGFAPVYEAPDAATCDSAQP